MRPWLATALAAGLRLWLASGSHSGAGTPPRFGDFEAQRHWMELTVNLPLRDWYVPTKDNDLTYWGLDYPPLTALHSWLCGVFLRYVDADAVALHVSRGYEGAAAKAAMRATVLASDAAIFFPAAWAMARAMFPANAADDVRRRHVTYASLVLQPLLIAIDHGHFQYNCVSLGLSLVGAAMLVRRPAVGASFAGDAAIAAAYVSAIFHKHISLYYAPAFFALMLGDALSDAGGANALAGFRVVRLGVAVLASAVACLGPFLVADLLDVGAGGGLHFPQMQAIIGRLLPFGRGVYEDYVSNFWCATNPLFRWKREYAVDLMSKVCAATTVAACVPAIAVGVSKRALRSRATALVPLVLAASALAFFLFAFQVHEKGILYACLPIAALAGIGGTTALSAAVFHTAAVLSCRRLLALDGALLPAVVCAAVYACAVLGYSPPPPRAAFACAVALAALVECATALPLVLGPLPLGASYPYAYAALDSLLYFSLFASSFLVSVVSACRLGPGVAARRGVRPARRRGGAAGGARHRRADAGAKRE